MTVKFNMPGKGGTLTDETSKNHPQIPDHDGVQAAHYGVLPGKKTQTGKPNEEYVSPSVIQERIAEKNRLAQENALRVYRETDKSPLPYGREPDGATESRHAEFPESENDGTR